MNMDLRKSQKVIKKLNEYGFKKVVIQSHLIVMMAFLICQLN